MVDAGKVEGNETMNRIPRRGLLAGLMAILLRPIAAHAAGGPPAPGDTDAPLEASLPPSEYLETTRPWLREHERALKAIYAHLVAEKVAGSAARKAAIRQLETKLHGVEDTDRIDIVRDALLKITHTPAPGVVPSGKGRHGR